MAKNDWRARLLAAFTNRDSAALTEALAAAPKDEDGDDNGPRTVININGAPAMDAKSKDDEPEPDDKGATTDAFKGIKDSLDRLGKRMDSMEESIKEVKEGKDAKRGKDAPDDPDEELKVEGATDEDEVETAEEKAAKEGKDGKGKDAKDSGIVAAIQDTKSRAETRTAIRRSRRPIRPTAVSPFRAARRRSRPTRYRPAPTGHLASRTRPFQAVKSRCSPRRRARRRLKV